MPGFDGKGPAGAGPMTGRGMGWCRCGCCGGCGYNYQTCCPCCRMSYGTSKKDKEVMLKQEAEALKEELSAVEKELKSINS